jgi:hypothetical protein
MNAEDLREQRVILLVDALLRIEVVKMSSEAPMRRDKINDSSDDSLDLVAISLIVEALKCSLTKAPRVYSQFVFHG